MPVRLHAILAALAALLAALAPPPGDAAPAQFAKGLTGLRRAISMGYDRDAAIRGCAAITSIRSCARSGASTPWPTMRAAAAARAVR